MTKVPVNLDALCAALGDPRHDTTHYVDLRTGQILSIVESSTEGEDPEPEVAEVEAHPGRYLVVPPEDSQDRFHDMEEFVEGLAEGALRTSLEKILLKSNPFREFNETVHASPQERQGWKTLRRDRIRKRAVAWLEEQGIEPAGA